jgi:hypothetical protein
VGGVKVAVAPVGRVGASKVTESLKPFWPVTVTVNWTLPLIKAVTGVGMASEKSGVKLAVRVTGALTVKACGATGLLIEPVNPVKAQPGLTAAPAVTWVPAGYHPPGGVRVTLPAADGPTEVATAYCVVKLAV